MPSIVGALDMIKKGTYGHINKIPSSLSHMKYKIIHLYWRVLAIRQKNITQKVCKMDNYIKCILSQITSTWVYTKEEVKDCNSPVFLSNLWRSFPKQELNLFHNLCCSPARSKSLLEFSVSSIFILCSAERVKPIWWQVHFSC